MATQGLPAMSSFLPEGFRMEQQRKLAEAIAWGASQQVSKQALGVGMGMLPPGMPPMGDPPMGGMGMTPPSALGMAPPLGGLNAPVSGGIGVPPSPMGMAPRPDVMPMPQGPAASPPMFARGGVVQAQAGGFEGGPEMVITPQETAAGSPPQPLTVDQLVQYVAEMKAAEARGEDPASVPPPGGGSDGLGSTVGSGMDSMVSGLQGDGGADGRGGLEMAGLSQGSGMAALPETADDDGEADLRARADAEPAPTWFVALLDAGDAGEPADITQDMIDLHQSGPALDGTLYQIFKGIAAEEPESLPAVWMQRGRVRKAAAEPVQTGRRAGMSEMLPPGFKKGGA